MEYMEEQENMPSNEARASIDKWFEPNVEYLKFDEGFPEAMKLLKTVGGYLLPGGCSIAYTGLKDIDYEEYCNPLYKTNSNALSGRINKS